MAGILRRDMGGLRYACLAPKEAQRGGKASTLSSKIQHLHIYMPAGCNGPIGNYTGMYFLKNFENIYVWESFFLDAVAGRQESTGIYIVFIIKEDEGEPAQLYILTFFFFLSCFTLTHSGTGAIFEISLAHLLYANTETRVCVCLNALERRDLLEPHFERFPLVSCRGGQRSSLQVPVVHWVLYLLRESGTNLQVFCSKTFSGHFDCFVLSLTGGVEKAFRSQALCKYTSSA